jgi:hypothetical protein
MSDRRCLWDGVGAHLILPGVRAAAHRSIAAPCAATDRSIGTRRWAGVNALDIGREKFLALGSRKISGLK